MRLTLIVFVGCLIFVSCKKKDETPTNNSEATYNPGEGWSLEWSDDFNTLNTSTWNYETGTGTDGWGNNELQYYRAENANIEDGNLVITAKKENYASSNFTSARLTTSNKFSFKYGKIVGRLKVPEGYGIWPAFWMLGDNIGTVGWPSCGEIDIMEMTCGQGANGDKKCFSTSHWRNGSGNHEYYGNDYIHTTNLSNDYHYYELEWSSTKIIARFDGVQFHEMNITAAQVSELRDHNYFLILNVAVGGNIFYPALTNPANVTATFPQKMYVDWIRVYKQQ